MNKHKYVRRYMYLYVELRMVIYAVRLSQTNLLEDFEFIITCKKREFLRRISPDLHIQFYLPSWSIALLDISHIQLSTASLCLVIVYGVV